MQSVNPCRASWSKPPARKQFDFIWFSFVKSFLFCRIFICWTYNLTYSHNSIGHVSPQRLHKLSHQTKLIEVFFCTHLRWIFEYQNVCTERTLVCWECRAILSTCFQQSRKLQMLRPVLCLAFHLKKNNPNIARVEKKNNEEMRKNFSSFTHPTHTVCHQSETRMLRI